MTSASATVSRPAVPEEILTDRIVVIMRGDYGPELAARVGRTLLAAGIRSIEVTTNSPQAQDCIAALAATPGLRVGAGTVLDDRTARRMVEIGATFLVTPVVDPGMIAATADRGVPVLAGAFSPSEIWSAWRAGAAAVKVFPAHAVGPGYLAALHGPFPEIAFVPTGGVDAETAPGYLRAGAVAVAVASSLLPQDSSTLSLGELARRAGALRSAVDGVTAEGAGS